MPLQQAVQLAQRAEVIPAKVAPLGQRGIPGRAGVALGEDKAIPVGPVRAGGIDAHHAKIERGEDVGRGQGAAGVTGLCGVGHVDDVVADLGGHLLQTRDVQRRVSWVDEGCGHGCLLGLGLGIALTGPIIALRAENPNPYHGFALCQRRAFVLS